MVFRGSDIHIFEKLNTLSIDIVELNIYQDENKWKQKIIPTEISKKESDRVIESLIYKNHYVLIKKLNVFLGKQDCGYTCRRCLNSYTSQNVIFKQKQLCEQQEMTSIRISNETHLYWKKRFHKNPI